MSNVISSKQLKDVFFSWKKCNDIKIWNSDDVPFPVLFTIEPSRWDNVFQFKHMDIDINSIVLLTKNKMHLSQTILIASALKIKAINNKQWWTMCFAWNSSKSDYFSFLAAVGVQFDVYLHSSRIAVGNSVFIIRQHLNFYHLKLNCDCVYSARFMCQLVGAVSHANCSAPSIFCVRMFLY